MHIHLYAASCNCCTEESMQLQVCFFFSIIDRASTTALFEVTQELQNVIITLPNVLAHCIILSTRIRNNHTY